jgi:hypothetical protein
LIGSTGGGVFSGEGAGVGVDRGSAAAVEETVEAGAAVSAMEGAAIEAAGAGDGEESADWANAGLSARKTMPRKKEATILNFIGSIREDLE